MFEFLTEIARGRGVDKAKARRYVEEHGAATFREAMADYDAFADHASAVAEAQILIGTGRDSSGREVPLRLSLDELAAHALVQGATGSGKTSFAAWLMSRAMSHGFPVGTIDCKAGFHDLAIEWAAAQAYRLSQQERAALLCRLVVVNPFGEALVPLNVCRVAAGGSAETQAYDVALVLSRLFDSQMGFQMENILRNLLLLLMEADLTLAEAPLVLQDEVLRGVLAERSANPAVKDFFGRTYQGVPAGSKDALLARLQALLLPENLRLMLGADDLIDFRMLLDRGDPLFMFLGMGPGVPAELVEIMGTLLLQLFFQAAWSGKVGGRRPYLVIADEFFHLIDVPVLARRFERGLDSLRAFGVHLALVMHQFSQVPGTLREAILQHCDLVALFRTSSRNAQYFGEFLPDVDPELTRESLRKTGRPPARHEVRTQLLERLQRLPDRHCYWYDRRRPHRAVLVRVPDVPQPHEAAGIPRQELEAFIDENSIRAGAAGVSKSALRAQVEARRQRLRDLINPTIRLPGSVTEMAPPPQTRRRSRLG